MAFFAMSNPKRIGTDLGENKVLADINEYGWHCMNVIEDDEHPPWSCTIGLFETWSHPELLVIGRSRITSNAMLTNIVSQIEANNSSTTALFVFGRKYCSEISFVIVH
jgi:hypothetical protein